MKTGRTRSRKTTITTADNTARHPRLEELRRNVKLLLREAKYRGIDVKEVIALLQEQANAT